MTPELQAELSADAFRYFGSVKLTLPDATLRLLDGSAALSIGGEAYAGEDSTYGVLASIESFSDGLDEQAPTLRVSLSVPTAAAAAALIDPAVQGSAIEVHIGAVDNPTGLVIADPVRVYAGEIDVPTLRLGRQSRVVEFDCVSILERLFDTDTGVRLSYAFHHSQFDDDEGLQYMVRILNHAPAGASYSGSAGGWTGGVGVGIQ